MTKSIKEKANLIKKQQVAPKGLDNPSPHLSIKKNLTPYVPVDLAAPGWQVVPEHVAVADGPPVGDDLVCVKDPEVAITPVRLAPGAGLAQVVATDRPTASTGEQVEFARTYDRYWPIGQAKHSNSKIGRKQFLRRISYQMPLHRLLAQSRLT